MTETATGNQIHTEIVEVTPDIAEQWLGKNDNNRSARRSKIKQYTDDMKYDRWSFDGAPIRFDRTGKLLDGQHRLRAVINSQTTQTFVVIRGLDPESQKTMDNVAPRSAADWLVMQGGKYSNLVQAVARVALGMEHNPSNIGHYPSSSAQQLEWVEKYPEIAEIAVNANHIVRRVDTKPSLVLYSLWRFSQIDSGQAYEFWRAQAEKTGLVPGDPRIALMNRTSDARIRRENLSRNMELSMIFRAWNAWRAGQTMAVLRINSNGVKGGLVGVPEPK